MDDRSSLKKALSDDVNRLHFGGHHSYLWNGWSHRGQILYTGRLFQIPAYWWNK